MEMNSVVDPRLGRGLWQVLVLGGIAAVLASSAGAGALPVGSAAWLVVAPAVALLAAYRNVLAAAGRRLLSPTRRREPTEARASVRLPSRGARNASDRHLVPGRRAARQQHRSPRHD